MSLQTFALSSLVLAFAVGCGSSTDTGDNGAGDSGSPSDTHGGGDSDKTDTAGGTDTTSGTDTKGGTDTTTGTDTTPPPGDGGLTCGTTTCDKGQVCCAAPDDAGGASFTCATSCPDGSVPIACLGGKDCGGTTPYCCGSVTLDPSTPPCGFSAGAASCTSSCQTDIPLACSGTHKARLCDKVSDCADDTGYLNCCTFSTPGGASGTVCASDTMKAFASSCL